MATLNFDPKEALWTSVDMPPLFNPQASLGQVLLHAIKTHGSRVAQINTDTGIVLRYDEILSKSIRVAQNLRARGYQKGQLIGFITRNTHHVAPTVLGSMYLGCTVGAIDDMYKQPNMTNMLKITQPVLMFCHISLYDIVKECLDDIGNTAKIFTFDGQVGDSEPVENLMVENGDETSFLPATVDAENEVALVTCSSGTTGTPKAASHSHAVLTDNITRLSMFNCDDVILCFSALHWMTGVRSLLHGTLVGAKRLITIERATPQLQLRLMEQHKVTCVLNTAFQTVEIYQSDALKVANLSSVRHYFVAGDSIPQNVAMHVNNHLPNGSVNILYGLSETSGTITADFPVGLVNGSVGRFKGGICAKIIDENGGRCGIGVNGKLCVKGTFRFLGYYANQTATDELFDDEGFLLTGDIAHITNDGLLYILERAKNIILYKDFFVYPTNIELKLLKSPLIQSMCAVGIPHDCHGEIVAAAIVPTANAQLTEQMVHDMVDERLADYYKLRGGVYFVDSIPITSNGKMVRGEVKETVINLYNEKKLSKNGNHNLEYSH